MDAVKILSFWLFITALQTPPSTCVTVTSRQPKVDVHEHTDAVLSCEFRTEKDRSPRIEWKKRGRGVTFVYFDGRFSGAYAGRASMDGATLTIHSITQKDSGDYRCEVTASQDHVNLGETTVSLNVLVPPHVPSCEVPSTVFAGSDLELLCKDQLSVPPATYRWYKDNKLLATTATATYNADTEKGTLSFHSVSVSDAGMYRCESSNSVGSPKSCVAQHLAVIQYQLSVSTLAAGGGGLLLLLLMACLCVCLCRRQRGCCHKEYDEKSLKPYSPPPPPPPARNPKNYKHSQSFMI